MVKKSMLNILAILASPVHVTESLRRCLLNGTLALEWSCKEKDNDYQEESQEESNNNEELTTLRNKKTRMTMKTIIMTRKITMMTRKTKTMIRNDDDNDQEDYKSD